MFDQFDGCKNAHNVEETEDATPSSADGGRYLMGRDGDLATAADACVTLERELTLRSEELRRLTKASSVKRERQDKV